MGLRKMSTQDRVDKLSERLDRLNAEPQRTSASRHYANWVGLVLIEALAQNGD